MTGTIENILKIRVKEAILTILEVKDFHDSEIVPISIYQENLFLIKNARIGHFVTINSHLSGKPTKTKLGTVKNAKIYLRSISIHNEN